MSLAETATNPVDLVKALEWRYSVKKFDNTRQIPPETWRALEQALVLTPSSFGLQPWRFYVVTDPDVKERLVAASFGQRQVADASHVVVFTIKKDLKTCEVGRFLGRVSEVQGRPVAALESLKKTLTNFVERSPQHFDINQWSANQIYIALGNFLTSAAVLGID